LVHSSPAIILPCPSHSTFFNSFQYISLYHLLSHLQLGDITDALSFFFPFPLSLSSIEYFHCYRQVLHMSLYMIMLMFVYVLNFGSIVYVLEKTCGFCVSDTGLLLLTWHLPIESIYCQTTCLYSLWLNKTPLCMYTTISWYFH
jgi:hypothetical protein